jgi:hypothetical protein
LSTGIITTTADGHIDSTEWLSMGWTMSTFWDKDPMLTTTVLGCVLQTVLDF